MMTFLLIYTHIAALVVGWSFDDWRTCRRGDWVDFIILAFIAIAWPWALYLIVCDERKGA